MVTNIPGFYYDEAKKKYFKIEKNGPSTHQYNSSSLKHKREEQDISSKISKFKLNQSKASPFIQTNVLDIKNTYKFNSSTQIKKDCIKYRLSNLELLKNQQNIPLDGLNHHSSRLNVIDFAAFDDTSKVFVICQGTSLSLYSAASTQSNKEILITHEIHIEIPNLQYHALKSSQGTLESGDFSILQTYASLVDGSSKLVRLSFLKDDVVSPSISVNVQDQFLNDAAYCSSFRRALSCGDKLVSLNDITTMQTIRSIPSNGDALIMDVSEQDTCYLGYRNGMVKLWDVRDGNSKRSFSSQNKLKGFKSITSLKKINENDIVCSSLGSKIALFDKRMGFNSTKIEFNSIKNVEDVFGEHIQVIDDNNFMTHNKNSVEIFNTYEQAPLKSISTYQSPIDLAYMCSLKRFELYLFRKNLRSSYNG